MFGQHIPVETRADRIQSPMAVFARGLQSPGTQWRFHFENGYGASVINDGYGADEGLYEVAVLDPEGHLTYDTPVTSDVLGYQTKDEVTAALDAISALTPESVKQAQIDREREERDLRIAKLEAELADLRAEAAR